MKSLYSIRIDESHLAQADLIPTDYGWIVTRIVVPAPFRGQGLGSRLMSEILADADAEKAVLFLEANAYGGLSDEQLRDWYTRRGFSAIQDFYVREPNEVSVG